MQKVAPKVTDSLVKAVNALRTNQRLTVTVMTEEFEGMAAFQTVTGTKRVLADLLSQPEVVWGTEGTVDQESFSRFSNPRIDIPFLYHAREQSQQITVGAYFTITSQAEYDALEKHLDQSPHSNIAVGFRWYIKAKQEGFFVLIGPVDDILLLSFTQAQIQIGKSQFQN